MVKKIIIILLISVPSFAQEIKLNKFGLYVVDEGKIYQQMVSEESSKMLIDLEEIIVGIELDIKYAAEDNFLGNAVYKSAKAFLRLPAALALKNVQDELKLKGFELKIFDAYRPYSVTILFYENYYDTTYVASPWKGSKHNRGCAVDLTIILSETKEEIEMSTAYDDFTEKAHAEFKDLPENVIKNREALIDIMERNGFTVYKAEWWHFDFNGWETYELIDLTFEELNQINLNEN